MDCVNCKSHRTMKFVDGFGNKRVFCRSCGRSFLEHTNMLPDGQKNLLRMDSGLYYRPGAISIRR